MRRTIAVSLIAAMAVAGTASAQPAPGRNDAVPSPWWMRDPVVASQGSVRTEIEANRAFVSANFVVVDGNVSKATEKAAAQIRELGAALERIGGDKVRVQTSFSTQPLYEQYRDANNNLVDNRRPDKIDRYAVTANVTVQVRDVALIERVYSVLVAAKPAYLGGIGFSLQPTNEQKAWIYQEAIKDAARRARAAAEAAGGHLGPPKVIDPSGRVCETDVLVLRETDAYAQVVPTDVDYPSSPMVSAPPPPPPPPPPPAGGASLEAAAANLQLTVQPPVQELTAQACVIYALQ